MRLVLAPWRHRPIPDRFTEQLAQAKEELERNTEETLRLAREVKQHSASLERRAKARH